MWKFLIIALLLIVPSHAEAGRFTFGELVVSPVQAYIFCINYRDQCRPHRGKLQTDAVGAVVASDRLIAQLDEINRRVNRNMTYAAELEDTWSVNRRYGDCEDYALEKRRLLLAAGWPSSALILGIGTDRFGAGHAVLIVRLTSGDLVLDNQIDNMISIYLASIRFRMIQSPVNFREFHSPRF